jgi:hypothetical protein
MTKQIDATEARQGETPHRLRYVLAASLAAAVFALALVAVAVGS